MAIVEQVQAEIASVGVNDEYRVELTQFKKSTDYSPDQAVELAAELLEAAADSRRLLAEQAGQVAERLRNLPASVVI